MRSVIYHNKDNFMSTPIIIPVTNKADKLRFIKSQWNFYKGDNSFVPPIIMDREKLLDEKKIHFINILLFNYFLQRKMDKSLEE